MKTKITLAGLLIVSGAFALAGRQSPASKVSGGASAQRAFIDQYCATCHNQRAKSAGLEAGRKLTLDDKDLARVRENAQVWELVVRKVRSGMMPPVSSGAKKPEPAALNAMVIWLENELDRNAPPYLPPPGLHRL